MNWKIAIVGIGALLVGAAVAVLITGGGGETTVVERTVPAEEPAAETDTTEEPEPTEVVESEPPEPEGVPLGEEVPRADPSDDFFDDANIIRGDRERTELDGEALSDPAVFQIGLYSASGPWVTELAVPGFSRLTASRVGWADGTATEVAFTLNVYADDRDTEPIYSETFEGPGDAGDMDIDIEGTNTLIFEWDPEMSRAAIAGLGEDAFFVLDEALLLE